MTDTKLSRVKPIPAQGHMDGAFLEWALEAFSGYAAVDEL